jgi:peptide-methionine (S)-S-oxide reductase
MKNKKIGFGGGCHWCTEAYFQSLNGVVLVEQGWISSISPDDTFSEAVIVHYNPKIIGLKRLIEVHLHTHASTKLHSFRKKYRSAVYVFDDCINDIQKLINNNQANFNAAIITKALAFSQFKLNIEDQQNYYIKHKNGAFCQKYIVPKLDILQKDYLSNFKKI